MRLPEAWSYIIVCHAALAFKCLPFSVGLLAVIQSCWTQPICPTIQDTETIFKNIKRGTRRTGLAFNTMGSISFLTCVKECQLRSHCAAVGYSNLYHECRLYDVREPIPAVLETGFKSIYLSLDSMNVNQVYLEACSLRDCPNGFRCKNTESGKLCEPSECPNPPDKGNADLHIVSHAIGSRGKYMCRDGYTNIGTSVILCETNQTWTDTSFECVEFQMLPGLNTKIITVNVTMDFQRAKAYCSRFDGGHLIQIDSEEKSTALVNFLQDCVDNDMQCSWWASQGECTINPDYMLLNCKLSCHQCWNGDYHYYIDAYYDVTASSWTYSDSGESLSYFNWYQNEPNRLGTELCVMMKRLSGQAKWFDIGCSVRCRSVCEID